MRNMVASVLSVDHQYVHTAHITVDYTLEHRCHTAAHMLQSVQSSSPPGPSLSCVCATSMTKILRAFGGSDFSTSAAETSVACDLRDITPAQCQPAASAGHIQPGNMRSMSQLHGVLLAFAPAACKKRWHPSLRKLPCVWLKIAHIVQQPVEAAGCRAADERRSCQSHANCCASRVMCRYMSKPKLTRPRALAC